MITPESFLLMKDAEKVIALIPKHTFREKMIKCCYPTYNILSKRSFMKSFLMEENDKFFADDV